MCQLDLAYIYVCTRAVTGQFSGPSVLHGLLKFKVVFVANQLRDLSPSKSLKPSFTLNCVLKRAKDLKLFQFD